MHAVRFRVDGVPRNVDVRQVVIAGCSVDERIFVLRSGCAISPSLPATGA